MKFRTFLLIIVVLVLLGLIFTVALDSHNADVLTQRFQLPGSATVGVGWMVLWSFVAGLAIAVVVGLSREAGRMVDRWRRRKASRKSEEIEEEYSRGLVAVLERREEEALVHFRAVLERDSRHFYTLIKLGDVLRSQGRYSDAIEYHRKAHHLKEDDTRPLYALVEDYDTQGDMERAKSVVGRILAINKSSVAAWRQLRSLHVKEKNWEKALEAHQRVAKLSEPSEARKAAVNRFGLGIRYQIAASMLEAGHPKEAANKLRRVLKDDDSFIAAHVKLGEALRESGQDLDAVTAWHDGFEVTGSPIFLTLLEEHFLRKEQPLAAIEALKNCIERARRGKGTLPRFYLGKLYFRLEMLDDALAVLSSVEGRATRAPTLHYLLGRIHERRNQFREAAVQYRTVIKETNLVELSYLCRACREATAEWVDCCPACGEWNSVEVDFILEIPLEELGLAPAPIYIAED